METVLRPDISQAYSGLYEELNDIVYSENESNLYNNQIFGEWGGVSLVGPPDPHAHFNEELNEANYPLLENINGFQNINVPEIIPPETMSQPQKIEAIRDLCRLNATVQSHEINVIPDIVQSNALVQSHAVKATSEILQSNAVVQSHAISVNAETLQSESVVQSLIVNVKPEIIQSDAIVQSHLVNVKPETVQ